MQDPRLYEIDFLSMLERRPSWSGHVSTHNVQNQIFGLPARVFKQMLFELLVDGCVGGSVVHNRGSISADAQNNKMSTPLAVEAVEKERNQTLNELWLENRETYVVITHKGRLRLWRLRDEIFARRRRDDLGVLWAKPHYLDDLAIALAMRAEGGRVS